LTHRHYYRMIEPVMAIVVSAVALGVAVSAQSTRRPLPRGVASISVELVGSTTSTAFDLADVAVIEFADAERTRIRPAAEPPSLAAMPFEAVAARARTAIHGAGFRWCDAFAQGETANGPVLFGTRYYAGDPAAQRDGSTTVSVETGSGTLTYNLETPFDQFRRDSRCVDWPGIWEIVRVLPLDVLRMTLVPRPPPDVAAMLRISQTMHGQDGRTPGTERRYRDGAVEPLPGATLVGALEPVLDEHDPAEDGRLYERWFVVGGVVLEPGEPATLDCTWPPTHVIRFDERVRLSARPEGGSFVTIRYRFDAPGGGQAFEDEVLAVCQDVPVIILQAAHGWFSFEFGDPAASTPLRAVQSPRALERVSGWPMEPGAPLRRGLLSSLPTRPVPR